MFQIQFIYKSICCAMPNYIVCHKLLYVLCLQSTVVFYKLVEKALQI